MCPNWTQRHRINHMINIIIIDLTLRGVTLPRERVGMVIAQPFLNLSNIEPYRCNPEAKDGQLDALKKTLELSLSVRHGAQKTHFTIFPEYSIPGIDGIEIIDEALNAENWPNGTVVIGGIDALSKEDFLFLSEGHDTEIDINFNALNRVEDNEWINCCITWIKCDDGTVMRWLQPKVSRAWNEQNVTCYDMFLGRSIFIFKGRFENGTNYYFSTLVCFDWIATVDGKKPWVWLVEYLHTQAEQAQAELSLTWLFVIQHNPRPSHDEFLSEVRNFFNQTIAPNVHRTNSCIVFANNAGYQGPGKTTKYGNTSLIFSPQALFTKPDCRPTFCNGGQPFRLSTLLNSYYDVLFRERGACIHSFVQVNPKSLNAGAAGRVLPIERPYVYPINGNIGDDPRTPANQVPACVKWFNDWLDNINNLSTQYPGLPLNIQALSVHEQSIAEFRAIPAQRVEDIVKLATTESKKHADEWGDGEASAVEHLVHTLNIIGLGFPDFKVGDESVHATIQMNDKLVSLQAIRGNTHESCIQHSKNFITRPRRQTLLISRDRDNTLWRSRFGSFLETENTHFGQERKITEPRDGYLHLDYQKLLDIFLKSSTQEAVKDKINDELD